MAIRVRKAKDIKVEHWSWLIFGRPRAGKTALIGTFPAPICVINPTNENGATTLRGHSGVTVIDVSSTSEIDEAIDWFYANGEKEGFRTVALDSLTSVEELLRLESPNWDKPKADQRPEYKVWAGKIVCWVDRLRAAPVESVFTATLSAVRDEVTGEMFGGPALFKSLEERLPAKFDATIYMETKEELVVPPPQPGNGGATAPRVPVRTVTRKAHLVPVSSIISGVRGCLNPKSVENPTYERIMAEIQQPLFT